MFFLSMVLNSNLKLTACLCYIHNHEAFSNLSPLRQNDLCLVEYMPLLLSN